VTRLSLDLFMSNLSAISTGKVRKKAIIPVFLPGVGCRQRCIFCNQEIVTDVSRILLPEELERHILRCLSNVWREKFSGVEVAFYGGSFTGLPPERQREYFEVLRPFRERGEVDAIRISTRPDFVDAERIALLKASGVRVIEIGAQSMDDEVLERARRGYTARAVVDAARAVHEFGLQLGIHLMLGLPGDTVEKALRSADEVITLKPHFVRIHPTLVLRDTELARMYQDGHYVPWSPEAIVETAKDLLTRFDSAGIRVARIGLQPSARLLDASNILAGYNHPALKEVCESLLFFDQMKALVRTSAARLPVQAGLTFLVNPKDMSKAVGHGKENLKKLQRFCRGTAISFHADGGIPRGKIVLADD
jgi:radical SAM enzyme (TIGR01210 family)